MNPVNTGFLIAGTVMVLGAAYYANRILLLYRSVPWNTGPYRRLGRIMFSKALVIAIILNLSLVAGSLVLLGFGRPLWFEVIRLITFASIVPVLRFQWLVYRDLVQSEYDEGTGWIDLEDEDFTHH